METARRKKDHKEKERWSGCLQQFTPLRRENRD